MDLSLLYLGRPAKNFDEFSPRRLQILGFAPCYHTITDLIPRAQTQGLMWLKAMQTEDKAVRQKILTEKVQGYSAMVDAPGCFFVEDWIEMYPDAKVGLMLRLTLLSKSNIN